MIDVLPIFRDALEQSAEVSSSLVESANALQLAGDALFKSLSSGHKILICGNGGSAADAAHFATEFVVRFTSDRAAYPAISLTGNSSLLTAAANDYGFDEVFARQVAAYGKPGDVLICLTTSGNSRNVQRALEQAKASQLISIAFLGRDGGGSIGLADIELIVRSESAARIQEAHMFLLHVLCESFDASLAHRDKDASSAE